jgi:hypothetical protein
MELDTGYGTAIIALTSFAAEEMMFAGAERDGYLTSPPTTNRLHVMLESLSDKSTKTKGED